MPKFSSFDPLAKLDPRGSLAEPLMLQMPLNDSPHLCHANDFFGFPGVTQLILAALACAGRGIFVLAKRAASVYH
jgi:hypothetical protein